MNNRFPEDPIHGRTIVQSEALLIRLPTELHEPALFGGMIRVSVLEDDQLLERHESPLEVDERLFLSENPVQIEHALAHFSTKMNIRGFTVDVGAHLQPPEFPDE